ncbi:hypothetical protein F511_07109 [Dorcoceras hygrometricum]|nr:hypothetical protein F511_07109 [Dorcoceras hygrometricum]
MPVNDTVSAADVEKQLEAPIPWIGMYVAAASFVCMIGMAADAFRGFRSKKYWFPNKFFSLNATSLTLLAVAMKLPLDLTTRMYATTDRLAKVSSLIFLSTAMGNFMTCLGAMDNKDIAMNLTALGILVITVITNVCIQIIQMRQFLKGREMFGEELVAATCMLLLLVMMISTAVMVPTTKRYLELKYHEMLKMASDEEILESVEEGSFAYDKLKLMIQKYWVMTETSSSQFVIARSVSCTASGALCLLIAFVLAQAEVRTLVEHCGNIETASTYGWSVKWIVVTQSVGIIVGTIASAFRWFVSIGFKCCEKGNRSFKDEFKIETYWTQKLVEWKESSLPLQIRDRKWRKVIHDTKRIILNSVIRIQVFVILTSKIILLISVWFTRPIISFFHCIKMLKNRSDSAASRVHGIPQSESEFSGGRELSRYVLLLEGEGELPEKILTNIQNEAKKLIEKGKKQQPRNLINLLHKIGNFRGVRNIDGYQVPSLHSKEPPGCWSLPLVSLTSIAIALPNIPKHEVSTLLRSVDEGLFYVKLIEKSLDKKEKLTNLRNAADVIWVGVELYRKWEDKDLHETSSRGENFKETLQELSKKAERTVMNFKRDLKDFTLENPRNWPVKVIAANSMYRVSRRILIACESDEHQTDEGLFAQLCIMIANIMAACLTNLMHVIFMKCHRKAMKDESIRQAALLLGEAEEILGILQKHKAPSLDPDESEFIAKWCNLIKQKK